MTSPNRYDAGKNPIAKTKTSSYGSGLLAKVGNAIGSALKTAGNAIKTATQYVGNKVSQGLQAVAKGVTATAAAVSTTILAASALGGVSKNSLGKKAATAVAKSGVKASVKLSAKGEDLSESIKEKGQELGNKVEKTGSNIQQVTQSAQTWWNETVDEGVAELKEGVSYKESDSTAFAMTKIGMGIFTGLAVASNSEIINGVIAGINTVKYLNENPFTISVGTSWEVAAGGGVSESISLTMDSKGYIAFQHSANVVAGTPNAGVNAFVMITNAPSYKNLESIEVNNPALVTGGSYSAGFVGYDYTYMASDSEAYSGHTINFGIGMTAIPIPAELHSMFSYTETVNYKSIGGDWAYEW